VLQIPVAVAVAVAQQGQRAALELLLLNMQIPTKLQHQLLDHQQ
jgi:hypothetical protein